MNKNRFLIRRAAGPFMALALSASMLTAVPAFAALPSESDVQTVTITNIPGRDNMVKAYRIVRPQYGTYGISGYSPAEGVSLSDMENPKAEEITAIARDIINNNISLEETTMSLTGTEGEYSADLKAGEYIVLVNTGTEARYVYNPMVVSACYKDAGDAASLTFAATLNADSTFGQTGYAKRTTITADKTIINADDAHGSDDDNTPGGAQGDDLQVGDSGSFQITSQIPAWSDAYRAKGVIYRLTDSQDAGFDRPQNLTVTVGGQAVSASGTTFAISYGTAAADGSFTADDAGNDFVLDFASDYALDHAGLDVVVTYNARLNENAVQKMDPNTDKIRVEFSNNPYDATDIEYLEDDVEEYTFPVQIKKTGKNDVVLSGAEFTLTRLIGSAPSEKAEDIFTVTTDEGGIAQFNRLDEGIYTLQETKAPQGYTVNPDVFNIIITPEYGDDGKLSDYTIEMRNARTNNSIGRASVSSAEDSILTGTISDTPLQSLPSTGGEGSRRIMIFGVGLAGITCAIYICGRKRSGSRKNRS